ncbi:MAG: N-methyl-L-tryptophan oxidase [Anaerolineales bacterium]|nr:N-methyl-L-tryptophan oxidase [Anaerolineales bacterium]
MTRTTFNTIVLGLGAIGSGALYWLSRRLGGEVLGMEQFELGHVRGGSQDHSRIIRLSYHNTHYIELAKAAYAAWRELEADADESLLVTTGGLDLSPAGAAIPLDSYTDSMTAAGVPFELLSASETMYRWPQWRLTDDVRVLYQAQSGIAPAAKCMAAHLRMARANGATIVDTAQVTAITHRPDGVTLTAGGETYSCRHLVISAGAWSNQALAQLGYQLPLTVTKEQVIYFDTANAAEFAPERFPIWIWMDDPCYYGFPNYGEPGPKAAQDAGGLETDPDSRTFEPDEAARERVYRFVSSHLPGMGTRPLYLKTCLYTMPPDRDFVLTSLPTAPNVSVCVGAGHAFKFSSLLGQILSELALDGATAHDLTPFAIDRPVLLEENPVRNFMT